MHGFSDIRSLRKKAREQANRIKELQTWARNVAADSSNHLAHDSRSFASPSDLGSSDPSETPRSTDFENTTSVKHHENTTEKNSEEEESESSCWDSVENEQATAQTSDIGAYVSSKIPYSCPDIGYRECFWCLF